MANPGYVRSTDGNNADDGSTWALSNADLAGAISDAVAGYRIWVSDAHSATYSASTILTFPGSAASPNQILCGDDVAEPPTSLTTTGVEATGGTSGWHLQIDGSFYVYGMTFRAGVGSTGTNDLRICRGSDLGFQFYDTCVLDLATSGNSSSIAIGGSNANSENKNTFKNCTFKFANTGQSFQFLYGESRIEGGLISGSAITTLIDNTSGNLDVVITGFDMSGCASTVDLLGSGMSQWGRILFRDCKLPASWSGSLFAGSPNFLGLRAALINCSASDTNYGLWVEDYTGSIKHETTIVKDSGASDGATPLSWKMTTTANSEYPHHALVSPTIQKWNETISSSITITVDFVHDSTTALQDDEIWLEVEYLGTSGVPLSLFVDDAASDVIATPADQTTSSATWTTTGMTNPNKQKLSATFTPQEKGPIIARVHVAKASYTVYVDPVLQVS